MKSGLDNVSISLDGATAKTHDFVRGVKGSYDKIFDAINFFKKYPKNERPRIVLQSLIMGLNLDELKKLVILASNEKYSDDGIYFMVITKPNSPKIEDEWREKDKFNLWPKDIDKALKKMQILHDMKLKGYNNFRRLSGIFSRIF
jgi:MoaA/NifB/PqqE/SkfB family radical SAM enzyme